MEKYNADKEKVLKDIKQDFFRFRNGMVAQQLKNLYPAGTLIYGLNVPQFVELSQKYPKDKEIGLSLWNDKSSRESRLLALYILPPQELSIKIVQQMILEVRSSEEAEFLAFKILRHLQDAEILLDQITNIEIEDKTVLYCVHMFQKNLRARTNP